MRKINESNYLFYLKTIKSIYIYIYVLQPHCIYHALSPPATSTTPSPSSSTSTTPLSTSTIPCSEPSPPPNISIPPYLYTNTSPSRLRSRCMLKCLTEQQGVVSTRALSKPGASSMLMWSPLWFACTLVVVTSSARGLCIMPRKIRTSSRGQRNEITMVRARSGFRDW